MNQTIQKLVDYIEQTELPLDPLDLQMLQNEELNDSIMEECWSIIKQR